MKKDKVLFIVPFSSEHAHFTGKENIDNVKQEIRVYPYLGVCYLISGLENQDYDVELIDAPAENLNMDGLIKKVKEIDPKIVGLTITTFQLNAAYRIVNAVKQAVPSAKIILGGVHINHSPEDFKYFNADYGLRGDCEFTIKELVEDILKKKSAKKIKGIVYKEKNKLVITEPSIINDIDSIKHPDRTKLNKKKYIYPLFNRSFTTIISSRGCPYKCVYCGLPYNRQYKKRNIKDIIEELKTIESLGYGYVSFSDDIFTLDRQRVIEICKEIKKNNFKFKWGCSTRIDRVDYELLKIMKDSGCIDIRFGIESGNERVRKEIIHKEISDEQCIKAINASKKAGLVVTGFFLFGHPNETFKEMLDTAEFPKKLNLDFISIGIVIPIPNSETFFYALKEKKLDKTIWRDVILGKKELPFYNPRDISVEKMKKLLAKSIRSFYLRPKYILNQMISVKNMSDLSIRVRMGINYLLNRGFE